MHTNTVSWQRFCCAITAALGVTTAFSAAQAETITFTHEGVADGTLDGVPFSNAEYVIHAVGDTDDREAFTVGDGWLIEHQSASITIDGFGTFNIAQPTQTFVNNGLDPTYGGVGVSYNDPFGTSWIDSTADSTLLTWDMTTSIGPITAQVGGTQFFADPLMTSGGLLDFAAMGAGRIYTFTAVVPGPGGFILLAAVAFARRKRRTVWIERRGIVETA